MADRGPSFPFRIEGGRTAESVFDATDIQKIRESVMQIIQTGVDERVSRTIGTVASRLVFASEYVQFAALADRLKEDLETQEARIRDVVVNVEAYDDGRIVIRVQYRVREDESVEEVFEVKS